MACTLRGKYSHHIVSYFFESFAVTSRCNLHARVLYGRDDHHQAEALFKAWARAMDTATQIDPRAQETFLPERDIVNSKKKLILIDAGTGNLRSVQKLWKAVERMSFARAILIKCWKAGALVLPGVGAFGDFMAGLRARRLEEVVKKVVSRGVPMLASVSACRLCSMSAVRWPSTLGWVCCPAEWFDLPSR